MKQKERKSSDVFGRYLEYDGLSIECLVEDLELGIVLLREVERIVASRHGEWLAEKVVELEVEAQWVVVLLVPIEDGGLVNGCVNCEFCSEDCRRGVKGHLGKSSLS